MVCGEDDQSVLPQFVLVVSISQSILIFQLGAGNFWMGSVQHSDAPIIRRSRPDPHRLCELLKRRNRGENSDVTRLWIHG
uniref:Uncharacterized protein n=1 Tax=Candidatus Methanogaster sp. ANME-2c ERB4 TaxID=2759911 RepID=A0A7G9YII3_9EURY|nr:hypothetical protein IKJKAPDM_00008 [Methanosarcinales archaeon ANME-2c ERB4]QNO47817.1 hypothetical protein GNFHAPIE_00022 [Methanosarcinales archaeon ANME-2c ERB4]